MGAFDFEYHTQWVDIQKKVLTLIRFDSLLRVDDLNRQMNSHDKNKNLFLVQNQD